MKTLKQLLEQSTCTEMQENFIKALIKEWLTQKRQGLEKSTTSNWLEVYTIDELLEELK